jgi:hypothetical protein
MADKVEFVHARWSGPSVAAKCKLDRNTVSDVEVVIHDADSFDGSGQPPGTFRGNGECRLNDGPWTTVDAVLAALSASRVN